MTLYSLNNHKVRLCCFFVFGHVVVMFEFDCVFQAEDCIRYLVRSRGLGDVYKRQALCYMLFLLSILNIIGMDADCQEGSKLTLFNQIQKEIPIIGGNNKTIEGDLIINPASLSRDNISSEIILSNSKTVSYTHLTLPTIYSV